MTGYMIRMLPCVDGVGASQTHWNVVRTGNYAWDNFLGAGLANQLLNTMRSTGHYDVLNLVIRDMIRGGTFDGVEVGSWMSWRGAWWGSVLFCTGVAEHKRREMSDWSPEEAIAMEQRHILEGEKRVARQEALVRRSNEVLDLLRESLKLSKERLRDLENRYGRSAEPD
jgi:hypothetical protein